VYLASFRVLNQLLLTSRSDVPFQSNAVVPRQPEPSGLTLDEIRRIVLDVMG